MSNIVEVNNNQEISGFPPEVFNALKSSCYPNAKDESILMVLNYCKAAQLNPLLKAVHIVPMSVKTPNKDAQGKDVYEMRDVIMPGISHYRIQADRTGLYAGISEPEFGEDVTEVLGTLKVTFPRWCKVTVKKITLIPYADGKDVEKFVVTEYTAKELWIENYATKSRFDLAPNAMWLKRKYGQLAKCAEAQALRKAFPELLGAQPTAEEMEGRTFDYDDVGGSVMEKTSALIDKLDKAKVVSGRAETVNEPNKTNESSSETGEINYNFISAQLKAAKNISELASAMNLANKLTNPEEKKSALKQFREFKAHIESASASENPLVSTQEEIDEFKKQLGD